MMQITIKPICANLQVQTRINSKLQTLKGTLRSRYSSTRWSNVSTTSLAANIYSLRIFMGIAKKEGIRSMGLVVQWHYIYLITEHI